MNWTVIIPFGGPPGAHDRPARLLALDFTKRWYYERHGLSPLVVDCTPEPFSKGAAIDLGVGLAGTDGLVIVDCDVIVDPLDLERAMVAVEGGAPWAMPHATVYRLNRTTTSAVLACPPERVVVPRRNQLDTLPHAAPPGGGIVVCSRDAYDASGGMDPRFDGWGGDDISWARALDTLAGEGVRLAGIMWHLWHPPQPRRRGNRASPKNEALAALYAEAAGDVDAMRAIRA